MRAEGEENPVDQKLVIPSDSIISRFAKLSPSRNKPDGRFHTPWNKNLKVPPQYVTSQSHTRRHFKFELDVFSGQRIPDTFSVGSGSRYFFFHPAGNEIAHNFLLPIRFFFFFFLFHSSLTRHLVFFFVIQSPGHSFFNKRFYKSVPP